MNVDKFVNDYVCALCGKRYIIENILSDPAPEISICPTCDSTFDKNKVSWESAPNND